MNVRTFALLYGIVLLAVGVAGFIPALVTPYDAIDHELTMDQGAGHLFGLFPVNLMHNVVHLAFGVWGLAVYRNTSAAIGYARSVAIVYAILTILGLVPALSTAFGIVPLHGNDVWLHALLALIAAYFGFVRHDELEGTTGHAAPRPR